MEGVADRGRKRPKDAPSFVATIPLRATPAQAKRVESRFECARLLYNACLRVALDRAETMRADPEWDKARTAPRLVAGRPNPARAQAFRELRARHGFGEWALMSVASGLRVGWLREHVGAQEAQALGARAYDAANNWMLGQRGRPRFKGRGHGLHSLACKDRNGALRIAADGDGLQWGSGLVLPFAFDHASPCQWSAAQQVADGRLRFCRIVRTKVRGRWVYAAQLVLDGKPLHRYEVGGGLVGLDVGPSTVAVVSDQGSWKETFCAELEDKAKQLRRLQRRLDRQHRAGSPACFDDTGRHKAGSCDWRVRSRRARRTTVGVQELQRRVAEHRKSLHGNLANRILGRGGTIHTERLSYRALQRSFGRSVGPPGAGDVHHHPLPQGCKCRRNGGAGGHPDHPALPALRLRGGRQEAPQPAHPPLWLRGGGRPRRVLGLPRPPRGSPGPSAPARRGGRQPGARHAPGLRCRPASSSQQPASPAGSACRVRGDPSEPVGRKPAERR
jgi:putative transposase